VDILRLDIELFVFFHQAFTLTAKLTAILSEVATELDKVKNIDEGTSTEPNELVDKFTHHGLPCLSVVPLPPFFTCSVFIFRLNLLIFPEDIQALEELMEV